MTLFLCLEAAALLSLGECSHQKHRDDHTEDAIPLAASQFDSLILSHQQYLHLLVCLTNQIIIPGAKSALAHEQNSTTLIIVR